MCVQAAASQCGPFLPLPSNSSTSDSSAVVPPQMLACLSAEPTPGVIDLDSRAGLWEGDAAAARFEAAVKMELSRQLRFAAAVAASQLADASNSLAIVTNWYPCSVPHTSTGQMVKEAATDTTEADVSETSSMLAVPGIDCKGGSCIGGCSHPTSKVEGSFATDSAADSNVASATAFNHGTSSALDNSVMQEHVMSKEAISPGKGSIFTVLLSARPMPLKFCQASENNCVGAASSSANGTCITRTIGNPEVRALDGELESVPETVGICRESSLWCNERGEPGWSNQPNQDWDPDRPDWERLRGQVWPSYFDRDQQLGPVSDEMKELVGLLDHI